MHVFMMDIFIFMKLNFFCVEILTLALFLGKIYHAYLMGIGLKGCWAEAGFSAYWHCNNGDMKTINNLYSILTFSLFDLCCPSPVPGPWGIMMISEHLCSVARLIIKKTDQKVAFHYCFPHWKMRSTEWISAERVSKRVYVTLSLVEAVGMAMVLLQISWVLPNAACMPTLSVSQPGIMPTPAQPDPDGGVCEALALKKHFFYLFSAVLLSLLSFLSCLCTFFESHKHDSRYWWLGFSQRDSNGMDHSRSPSGGLLILI